MYQRPNVAYPGSLAVASIGISPEFTFDNTCEIADANPVWVDWKDGHETRWTVNTPDSDWTSNTNTTAKQTLSLIHNPEPTRPERISYAVSCLKKKQVKLLRNANLN